MQEKKKFETILWHPKESEEEYKIDDLNLSFFFILLPLEEEGGLEFFFKDMMHNFLLFV